MRRVQEEKNWLGGCYCIPHVLCSTKELGVVRMICVSLFFFEPLKENFHIVWVFFPIAKCLHSKQVKSLAIANGQVFPVLLIL